ncbi:MAG: cytidine deaminase [Bacteroidota bacterium]|nr:cytidine deaminase [Bacteroidota bacterium]
MKYKELIEVARNAKNYSYSPYSKFRVGAAVLTKAGKIYSGCNIENSSYSLTICAERTALFKAISVGEREFVAIVILTDEKDFTTPCGACRQVISDLAGNIEIILTNGSGKIKKFRTNDLLPHPFTPPNLE